MEPFEELRDILLRPEQQQLRDLEERLEDRARRTRDVAGVLPQAVTLSHGKDAALARALQPGVLIAIRESIKQDRKTFIDAFRPILGALISSFVNEQLRGLMQTINQKMEHTLSPQGLKWRWEAYRLGVNFNEYLLARSLVYRVEEVFLVHRETGTVLLQVTGPGITATDRTMAAGMFSALKDFAHDAFGAKVEDTLEDFRVGERKCQTAVGPAAFLAALITGNPPRAVQATLDEAIADVHIFTGNELAHYEGDSTPFESVKHVLEACLSEQIRTEEASGGKARSMAKAWLALGAVAALFLAVTALAVRAEWRWRGFLRQLDAATGLAVTGAEHGWLGASHVSGLRDPLSDTPGDIARNAGYAEGAVRFDWKAYFALDEISVARRFTDRFPGAPDAKVAVAKDGTATLSGAAPYGWLERVEREAPLVPGVRALVKRDLRVVHDPALVLARFEAAYPPPEGAKAEVRADGTLALSGKVPYEWLASVREGAPRLPGVRALAEDGLEVEFAPAQVLHRFTDRFGLPDTVNASVRDGTLTLSGEAYHTWLARVRPAAAEIPGIKTLDDRQVTDVDRQTFQQTRSVIESAYIYFLPAKDNFATEGFAALSRLPDEIRRCQTAARRLGSDIAVEIRGSADSTGGDAAKNTELSDRRARAVENFLVSCGLEAGLFKPVALGAPDAPVAPNTKPAAEQTQRRVAFHVLSPLSFPAP